MNLSSSLLTLTILVCTVSLQAQSAQSPEHAKVDYVGFLEATTDLQVFRASRLINIDQFNAFANDPNTIILDTRSKAAFDEIHIEGAIHLNFSDFTASKLAKVIPSKTTRILIYCNNNFRSKMEAMLDKSAPFALNIPTFINLHGYGYTNIYELSDYLDQKDTRVRFVGSHNQ